MLKKKLNTNTQGVRIPNIQQEFACVIVFTINVHYKVGVKVGVEQCSYHNV